MPSSRTPNRPPPASARAKPKLRLAPGDRERQILDGAIAYFSEVGFSGQTRELAKRLGITQPLLYRYFPNKQALVERVYQTVFEGRWNPDWIPLLQDRATPLRERLIEFYRQYAEATYRPEWIRIYMYAGLSDPVLNRRYIQLVRKQLMPVYCREVRHECGIPESDGEVVEEEIEFVWNLHGGVFYMAM
ncbi:MAG TPA: TetR/AcrR family transcriptional regulator, partial [Acetobacteraceae bacterium]